MSREMTAAALALLLLAMAAAGGPPPAAADVSRPGGAGHALLFRDHAVVLDNFTALGAGDALTFEAWISTSDYCHASALMSYAAPNAAGPRSSERRRTSDANAFVVFDPTNLVACRDFEYMCEPRVGGSEAEEAEGVLKPGRQRAAGQQAFLGLWSLSAFPKLPPSTSAPPPLHRLPRCPPACTQRSLPRPLRPVLLRQVQPL